MYTIRRLTLAVLLLLLLLPVPAHAKMTEEAMLEQAREHYQSGHYYFAVTWLGRLLRDYPATSQRREVLLLMAKSQVLSGREEKAKPYLRDLLREFPEVAPSLEPGLLRLAKAAEPPPPPKVDKPLAPTQPAMEKPAPAASGAPPAPTAVQQPSPEPAGVNVPTAKPAVEPEKPIPAPAAAAQQLPSNPVEKATTDAPAAKPAPAPEPPIPAPQSPEQPLPAKPPPAAAPTENARGTLFYTLAAGETVSQRKLDALLKKLEGAGFLPAVQVETKMGEVFRLAAGCYGDRKAAEKRKNEISRRGMEPFVTRSGDSFCIIAGSLMSDAAAQMEQKRLAQRGVRVEIVKTQVPLTVSRVSTGRFAEQREAEEAAKTLAALGIGATVVKKTGE